MPSPALDPMQQQMLDEIKPRRRTRSMRSITQTNLGRIDSQKMPCRKMVDFRDLARSLLTAREHRKRGKTPFAGRQA